MIEHNENIEGLHPDGLTSLARVAIIYDISPATIRRRWKEKKFPQPVKPFGIENYFKNSDLLEYNEKLEYEAV